MMCVCVCIARRRASFTFTGWSGDVQEQEMKNVPTTTRCTRLFTPCPVVCCTPSTSGQQAALPERVVPKTLVVSVFGSVDSTNGVRGCMYRNGWPSVLFIHCGRRRSCCREQCSSSSTSSDGQCEGKTFPIGKLHRTRENSNRSISSPVSPCTSGPGYSLVAS